MARHSTNSTTVPTTEWQLIVQENLQFSECLDTMLESKVLGQALFNLPTLLVAKHHKWGQQYGRRSIDNISGDS